jgi:uncharacterized protein with NRDE domain
MCLIFFSLNNHPKYKLIVAANRDEFYNRRTTPMDFWSDAPQIVGGRDLEASGTWMAMNRNGKISLVTNYRDPAHINPKAPSRGQLVSDYLLNGDSPDQYLSKILPHVKQYNGFNLLVGNTDKLWYLSNYGNGIQALKPGLYGLSNHLLDTPWPKVERGKEKFKSILDSQILTPEILFELLHDESRAEDQNLPDTGIGLERERALSSMFIRTNGYGTRCSTVVLIDYQNKVHYSERTYNTDTLAPDTKTTAFDIIE